MNGSSTDGYTSSGIISTLQAGRAFAALAVVFHHSVLSVDQIVAPIDQNWIQYFDHGYLGVDFFFVLSGFIIFYTIATKAHGVGGARSFCADRLVRIFVPYLPIVVALICLYTVLPEVSQAERQWDYLSSLFLLPTTREPALIVAWTLQHELVFYLYFALIYFSGHFWKGITLWVAMICLGNLFDFGELRPWKFFTAAINLEFIFGIGAAWCVMRVNRIPSTTILFGLGLAGAMAAMALFVWFGAQQANRILFGLAIACALVPIVILDISQRLRAGVVLLFLGNASYAIYLVHTPALSVISRIMIRLPLEWNWMLALSLAISLSAIIGCIFHLLIEKPGLSLARVYLKNSKKRSVS